MTWFLVTNDDTRAVQKTVEACISAFPAAFFDLTQGLARIVDMSVSHYRI